MKVKPQSKSCFSCDHCLPIGEGDHYCDEIQELVICEYDPSDHFMECKGKYYEKI